MALPLQRFGKKQTSVGRGKEDREGIYIQVENSEPELVLAKALTRIQIELKTERSIRDFLDEIKSMSQAVIRSLSSLHEMDYGHEEKKKKTT